MSEHNVWAAIKIMLFCNVYDYLVYGMVYQNYFAISMGDYKFQNVLIQLPFQEI